MISARASLFFLWLPLGCLASPTAEEFEPCKAQAVQSLNHCMRAYEGNNPQMALCWPESERAFRSCQRSVIERHSGTRDPRRRSEVQRAMERAQEEKRGGGAGVAPASPP